MKGSVHVRKYHNVDLNQCRRLWQELVERHREIYSDTSIGGKQPGIFFEKLLAKIGADQIWVAVADYTVVGLVGLELGKEEAELEPVVVSKAWRGQGIGRLLVEKAIDEARKKGAKYLNVMPVARNANAIEFFHELGFKNLGQIQLFIDFSAKKWKYSLRLHDRKFCY